MFKAIILAAGEGTRMKSKKSKVLHEILHKPLIKHVLDSVKSAGFDETITVLGRNYDRAKEIVEAESSKIVVQKIGDGEPYGTGYAVKLCKDYINEDDDLLVIYGDTPLIDAETIKEYFNYHNEHKNDITVLSAVLDDPKQYGRIVRKSGEFQAIVEFKEMEPGVEYTNEINSGIYLYKGKAFLDTIDKINDNNKKKEYMITDTIHIAKAEGYKVDSYITENTDIVLGVNDREDLLLCERVLLERENKRRLLSGVMIHNPESTFIDPDAIIDEDVELWGYVKIIGACTIKSGTVIENSTIIDSQIGENCEIINSKIESSTVHSSVTMGPYAHIRPNTVIHENAHIGNFVELKNANFGAGSKAGHLTYVGDADVGDGVNIGCGVVFANYDGKSKHRSTVEDFAFIGSNVTLVAPLKVGKNAFIAAGSTATKDTEEYALKIERSEERIIKDWVVKKGLKK